MRHIIFVCLVVLFMVSCGKKQESKNIIVQKPQVVQAAKKKEKMDPVSYEKPIDWVGSSYTVSISRFPDEELPMVEDEYGNKYYDNRVTVKVTRKDGSEFFNRTFTKSDFSSCVDESFRRNGALLGLVFVEAKGDDLRFGGSVGSPDPLSDEYIPIVMWLNRMGTIRMQRDTELDGMSQPSQGGAANNVDDEDGV